jgi:hypothetical protein
MYSADNFDEFRKAYDEYMDFVIKEAGPNADKEQVTKDANEYLRTHSQYKDFY